MREMAVAQTGGQEHGGVADSEFEWDAKGVGDCQKGNRVEVFPGLPESPGRDVVVHSGMEQESEDMAGIVGSCLGGRNGPSGVGGWYIGSAAAHWDL